MSTFKVGDEVAVIAVFGLNSIHKVQAVECDYLLLDNGSRWALSGEAQDLPFALLDCRIELATEEQRLQLRVEP